MDLDFEKPIICPFCGGTKPEQKNARDVSCLCTGLDCSDAKELD